MLYIYIEREIYTLIHVNICMVIDMGTDMDMDASRDQCR